MRIFTQIFAVIIGICGGTGAGKTTLVSYAARILGESNTLIIEQDHYYKHHPELSFEQRCRINFDHPDALDFELMTHHVQMLAHGNNIQRPVYSFEKHLRMPETVLCAPKKIILVEGILVFSHQPLMQLFDFKIYIDASKEIRVKRRVQRDIALRGRTLEEVHQRFDTTLHAMHERFIEPNKEKADLIVTNENLNTAKEQLSNWTKTIRT